MVKVEEHGEAYAKRWARFEWECERCGCKYSFNGIDCETFERKPYGGWYGLINCPECGCGNIVDLEENENE